MMGTSVSDTCPRMSKAAMAGTKVSVKTNAEASASIRVITIGANIFPPPLER